MNMEEVDLLCDGVVLSEMLEVLVTDPNHEKFSDSVHERFRNVAIKMVEKAEKADQINMSVVDVVENILEYFEFKYNDSANNTMN